MRQVHIMAPDDNRQLLNVIGESIAICGQGDKTKPFEVHLQQGSKGGGPPPHHHPWDEAFYVLEGTVSVTVAGETRVAEAGTLVHIPARTVHAYENLTEQATLLAIVSDSRGGELFEAIDANVHEMPRDIEKLVALGAEYGVEFLLDP